MPDNMFDVESYTVAMGMIGDEGQRWITIQAKPKFHGIPNRALIYFKRSVRNLGYVEKSIVPDYQGHLITANAQWDDFDDYYNLLRDADGLRFVYAYDGPEIGPPPVRNLLMFHLFMGDGEAPGGDANAIFAHLEAQAKKSEE